MEKLFGVYGGAYRRAVARQLALKGAKGLEDAVGGNFDAIGALECEILDEAGFPEDGFLVDIGCGAGRLACTLKHRSQVRYLGLDVAPALLKRAVEIVGRDDWRFEESTGPMVPAEDSTVDFVAMFSVATHLPHAETLAYMRDAFRALKAGGAMAISFLDPAVPKHRRKIRPAIVEAIATRLFWAPNVAHSVDQMRAAASEVAFNIERIESPSRLGQSLALLRKPA